jgi:FAD/FMN-containing dehydrogenase
MGRPEVSDGFIAQLRAALGEIWLGGDIPAHYRQDWSGLPPVEAAVLARPRTTAEVASVLRIAHEADVAVVPQGGLTGLAGGAQPIAGCVILSLERMAAIEEVDPLMASMTVQAGVRLQTIQQAAEDAGLMFGLDLGARGSCQIGGNLATNAGGNRVIRYGMAREHVLGLEVVLPDGAIVTSLNKMLKNNAGYDLKQLFIGSEGTLGVITRAVLRLQARPTSVSTLFCGCRDFDAVLALLSAARARLGPMLSAFEVMWPSFYDFMCEKLPQLRRPLKQAHGAYVLLEASGFDPASDAARVEALMGDLLEGGLIEDAVMATSGKDARDLWAVREGVSEYARILGPLTAFDVSLPASVMRETVAQIEVGFHERWTDGIMLVYGHIGDSNLHVVANVPSAGDQQPSDAISSLVYAAIRAVGGSISAEHGVGLIKKPYLAYSRTPEELRLMGVLKTALDPRNILNPGKVLTI